MNKKVILPANMFFAQNMSIDIKIRKLREAKKISQQ
jgi:hypothetical protein